MHHNTVRAVLIVPLCAIFLAAQGGLVAQRSRRGGSPGTTINAPPMKGVVISVRGKLQELAKKKIVIQADDNQIMTIRRSSKTKFLINDKEIKPFEVDLGSTVSIDVTEDNDLKLTALAVRVDPSEKKRPLGSR
jgi:hypothetical protein